MAHKYKLRSAISTDIPIMTEIFAGAFSNDRHTQLKVESGADPIGDMGQTIATWIESSQCDVLLAVDENSVPVGWACWARHGYDALEEEARRTRVDSGEIRSQQTLEGSARAVALQNLTTGHLRQWQTTVMTEQVRCRILRAIVVSPAMQAQGVGSLLVKWGTHRADTDGVFCWVHSSEAGVRVFEQAGFEVRQQLDINLDAYAPVDGDSTGAWGNYTFRYLVREPAPIVAQD